MSSYGIWLSAAGMRVNDHRQTVLANNMANADTNGFKRDLAVIRERRVESLARPGGFGLTHPLLDGLAGGVDIRPTHYSFAQGSIETTGRALDVAIQGDGFFEVRNGEETRYTRNGSFTINGQGELVLTSGEGRWRVLDENGDAIQMEPNAGPVSISHDGTIRQGNAVAGTIRMMTTADKQSLRKVGEGLFDLVRGEMVAIQGRLVPRAVEKSNFDVMQGLASMIETTRAYQMNATMIRLQDGVTDRVINTVGRMV